MSETLEAPKPAAGPLPVQAAAVPAGNTWSVGTLTYTAGGLLALFFWLLWGDFAWAIKERSVPYVVQLLFKKYEASNTLMGLVVGSLPQAIALALNPIISYRSDRHRGKWGRRLPFLLIPTPIAALAMVGLAFGPQLGQALDGLLGKSSPGVNAATLFVLSMFWTMFEFATITANAVFAALINDVVPRAVIGRFYGMFRALSLIAGMIFNFWLMGKAEQAYFWIFAGIGLLYGVGFMAMCFRVKEGAYLPPPPSPGHGFLPAVQTYVRQCYTQPYYWWYYATLAFSWMSFVPVSLFSIYFAKSLHVSMDTYGKLMTLTFGISLLFSFFIGYLVDRFHPLRAGLAAQALYALAVLWGAFFAKTPFTFGVSLVLFGVLSGTWMTSIASIGQNLFPKTAFAQFAAASQAVTAVGIIVVGPLMGYILDHTGKVYTYTYFASFLLTAAALFSGWNLHRRFVALGGPKHYVPPLS